MIYVAWLTWTSGYFLLGDSINTTVTVVATLQNIIVAYDALELTYLLLVGITAQVSFDIPLQMSIRRKETD